VPRLDHYWASVNPVSISLWPLSLLFGAASGLRRAAYRLRLFPVRRPPVPVLVVGNITVGGTGKTPLVSWLAGHLHARGWRPGIVSRGYGGSARHWPQQVRADSDPIAVGDEAVMLARDTGCPLSVGPDRPAAVAALLRHTDVDIVISDDGMQHYALARDLEIAVIDGERRLGNSLLLPAGPLREPASRLDDADIVVVNGQAGAGEYAMTLQGPRARPLHGGDEYDLGHFAGRSVHAVAAIGNPPRFFDLLAQAGILVKPHPFPDHHVFAAADLRFEDPLPILMTAKDAVKCRRIACRDCWEVRVSAHPDAGFVQRLDNALEEIVNGQKAAGHPGMSDLQG
jgi:tetraacyldisaccharide 4'-kinase